VGGVVEAVGDGVEVAGVGVGVANGECSAGAEAGGAALGIVGAGQAVGVGSRAGPEFGDGLEFFVVGVGFGAEVSTSSMSKCVGFSERKEQAPF
jgi:hypothetical protein